MDRKICLDSDIIINFLRKNSKTKEILEKFNDRGFCTTQINVFEIWSVRETKEENMIKEMFDSLNKVDFDENSALKAGNIQVELKKRGEIIEFRDLFIAAICITNDFELLTLNKKHFARLQEYGLKLVQ